MCLILNNQSQKKHNINKKTHTPHNNQLIRKIFIFKYNIRENLAYMDILTLKKKEKNEKLPF